MRMLRKPCSYWFQVWTSLVQAGRRDRRQPRTAARPTGGIAEISVSAFFTDSLVLAVGSLAGVLISCSPAAYAFARIRIAGRNLLFAVMISTPLLPFQVLIVPRNSI